MASKFIKLNGTAKWAKVFEDNRDMTGYNGQYLTCEGAYTIDLVLEPEEFKKLKDAGSQKRDKITDDGLQVKLNRKHKVVSKAGEVLDWASGAPEVVKGNGQPWNFEVDGEIRNGTPVEVTVVVYPTSFGNHGTRLEKVVVNPSDSSTAEDIIPF